MLVSVSVVCVSGSLLIGLIALFRYEHRHGARVWANVRSRFDAFVETMNTRMQHRSHIFLRQTVRQSIHYLFHQVLTLVLRCIQCIEQWVHTIARFNKRRANVRSVVEPSSHFSAIAEHKRNTELSESEKQHRRDQALSGL